MWLILGLVEFGMQVMFLNLGKGIVVNTGISFGLEVWGIWWWLGAIAILLLTFRLSFVGRELIWAGGLANGLSRFFLGGVVDYIRFGIVGLWFNLADVMICCGLAIVIWKLR